MSEDDIRQAIWEKKQQIELYKQQVKEQNKGLIDNFTQQDELLSYLLQEQQETNKHLQLSNKILYAIYLQGQGTSITPEQIDIDLGSFGNNLRTKVENVDNPKNLGNKQEIFRIEGSGFVSEIKFISSTSSSSNKLYSARIKVDDNVVYDGSWTTFSTRSLHETDVTAFEDDNNDVYILHFMNLFFIYNISVEIYNNSAEFTQIYIKYNKEA